jgi:UDP-N-acetyl-D-galactosamine dehydrogenase
MPADAIVLAVPHDAYMAGGWSLISKLLKDRGGVVMDVKSARARCHAR